MRARQSKPATIDGKAITYAYDPNPLMIRVLSTMVLKGFDQRCQLALK